MKNPGVIFGESISDQVAVSISADFDADGDGNLFLSFDIRIGSEIESYSNARLNDWWWCRQHNKTQECRQVGLIIIKW